MQVPRVRDHAAGAEVPLATYAALQAPRSQDAGHFRRVLGRLSTREYAAAAVPAAFGLARSSTSRRCIRASARELRQPQKRRLDAVEWVVLVLDGQPFAGDQIVVAPGVTATGEKRIWGLMQTASENKLVWWPASCTNSVSAASRSTSRSWPCPTRSRYCGPPYAMSSAASASISSKRRTNRRERVSTESWMISSGARITMDD